MKILFVCMGNICRSPTAHGLLLSLIRKQQLEHVIEVDSAGTHSWNIGSSPDLSSQKTAEKYGIDLSQLRARRVVKEDYEYYDYIVAMDKSNLANMLAECEEYNRHKLKLLLDYADNTEITEIPDPYGEGMDGFETVYGLIEQGCLGLLSTLKQDTINKTG
jgi:protein-tyrosine phosphatase